MKACREFIQAPGAVKHRNMAVARDCLVEIPEVTGARRSTLDKKASASEPLHATSCYAAEPVGVMRSL